MNKLILLVLLIFSFLSCYSQEKVVINNDTLVVITPKQLQTINGIIVDLEYSKREIELKDSLIYLNNRSIVLKDSIIGLQRENILIQENITRQIRKENKKKVLIGTGLGAILGVLLGIFIK